jgi:helicase
MKFDLPKDHGLSAQVVEHLVFKEDGKPALTDAQFDALDTGVGRGESALIVSPTSTGKTQIALWGIAKGLESSCNTVYLVTHRALAKQKFQDFKALLLANYLKGNQSSLVIATGDYVEDASGEVPAEPLRAPLLVATYEKYLALISSIGVPSDMSSTVVVCDEIQLIGDATRGQNVEVLLTLLRNAGWRQFVGLSAVLEPKDAQGLAEWLGVKLVINHTREKHLTYECWTAEGIHSVSSEKPDAKPSTNGLPASVEADPLAILASLLGQKKPLVPIIVFCMKKQDTYDLAEQFLARYGSAAAGQLTLAFDALPETTANTFLAKTLHQRVASHNADLTDEERQIVEAHLLDGKLDVVFATSTLAAGVNFPLGAAIFATWKRWNFDRRVHEPIEAAEFYNMAGRVGRMGFTHEHGRVIFVARGDGEVAASMRYLELGTLPKLVARISPERFNQLALQLVASGLCDSRSSLEKLVCTTFSGLREQDRNATAFATWPAGLMGAVDELVGQVLVLETASGKLVATAVGRAVAQSGLLPETGMFMLAYANRRGSELVKLLPTSTSVGEPGKLNFLLACVCFSSPEFRTTNKKQPTRRLPWPLEKPTLFDADPYRDDLPEPVWQADVAPINAAKLAVDWIEGAEYRQLEANADKLTAGDLRDMYRNLSWTLQGFAGILAAAADKRDPMSSKPPILSSGAVALDTLGKLPRVARRLSFRVGEGLPEEVLWMIGLNRAGPGFKLTRSEMLSLRGQGCIRPEQVMLSQPGADAVRVAAFAKVKPSPQAKSNWLRDACRDWKVDQRNLAAEKHAQRARRCANLKLLQDFYKNRGSEFEQVFESILALLKISFKKLDDKTKTGAPDYLIELQDSPPIVFELKSKEGDKLVSYNNAVEVLAASEVHGYKDAFCVTLCHPGVDPSVPLVIASCGRLSVVESNDLGEALLRICEGALTQSQLYSWLASPGQALTSDLPFRAYG